MQPMFYPARRWRPLEQAHNADSIRLSPMPIRIPVGLMHAQE
jgi:hypothetical protein